MPSPDPLNHRLQLALRARGPLSGPELMAALGISSPTLSRAMRTLRPAVERIGAARSTRYALRRDVRGRGSGWPLYRIGDVGRPRVWGELRSLYGGFRFVPQHEAPDWMVPNYRDGLFSGLPFFLQDIRPQGFLGRAIAREAAARIGTPEDVRLWSDDDALMYFLIEGYDLPGDLVIGDRALQRALSETAPVEQAQRKQDFPRCALSAVRGELLGSSAGGEQPKFLTMVRRESGMHGVLVKFSPADSSPLAQRWSDLLMCEHLASEILRGRRIPVARTEVIDSAGRRFLQVERFDRVGASGRRGVITLGTLEDAFLDQPSSDWAVAAGMLETKWIAPDDARTLRWIWCFGNLIANTDMHRANVSFWFGDGLPFRLAPFYDMLPMMYSPGAQGDLLERDFAPRPPVASVIDVWAGAAQAAAEFWQGVMTEPRVSERFRAVAKANRAGVLRATERFG